MNEKKLKKIKTNITYKKTLENNNQNSNRKNINIVHESKN